MRIILYTGKGGVGKTSVAASTALLAADVGYRTVLMSTDPAHSLGDSLDMALGPEPVAVCANLWAQEIDVLQELEKSWQTIQEWLVSLMRWQGMDEVLAEEVAVLPGMEELIALMYIMRYNEEGKHDLLVVDCAPTAETLRLLSFPDMARWYMHRIFPVHKTLARTLGPLARGILGVPVPGREVFDSAQVLYGQLEEVRNLLLDSTGASMRLVVNPEKMVIKEAQRTFTYLNLHGYHTDLIVCNRVIPDNVDDPFFNNWKRFQARNMELIHQSFDPMPVLMAPLMDREAVGQDALREMGTSIFDSQDPAQLFYTEHTQEIVREGSRYALKVKLPFTSLEEVSVLESQDEIIIQVGPYRRSILLPRVLSGLEVKEATMDGDTLTIRFKENPKAPADSKQATGR